MAKLQAKLEAITPGRARKQARRKRGSPSLDRMQLGYNKQSDNK